MILPITPNETQELKDNPKYNVVYKGHMTRSVIYETELPDGEGLRLSIDGPGDNFICMESNNRMTVRTGPRNPLLGSGSGFLNVRAGGGGHLFFEESLKIEVNQGADSKADAMELAANGNVTVTSTGGSVVVTANKISLNATENLTLAGGDILLQAGKNGDGPLIINAGSIDSHVKTYWQQKMLKLEREVKEINTKTRDPRGTVAFASAGHFSLEVKGDFNERIGGIKTGTYGGRFLIPLLTNRMMTYKCTTSRGSMKIDSAGRYLVDAKIDIEQKAQTTAKYESTGKTTIEGKAGVDIKADGAINVKATAGNIDIEATAGTAKLKAATSVFIEGANIFLN